MNTSLQRILVTGATGKQGGATVRALVRANETLPSGTPFEVLAVAVTRNPKSVAAKKVASLSNVKLVKGKLDDALFQAEGADIHGVLVSKSLWAVA